MRWYIAPVIRTTVMLPEETHARLRRLARRRGVPLAAVIREALTRAAELERPTLSFIGAVSVEGVSAEETTRLDWLDELPDARSGDAPA